MMGARATSIHSAADWRDRLIIARQVLALSCQMTEHMDHSGPPPPGEWVGGRRSSGGGTRAEGAKTRCAIAAEIGISPLVYGRLRVGRCANRAALEAACRFFGHDPDLFLPPAAPRATPAQKGAAA